MYVKQYFLTTYLYNFIVRKYDLNMHVHHKGDTFWETLWDLLLVDNKHQPFVASDNKVIRKQTYKNNLEFIQNYLPYQKCVHLQKTVGLASMGFPKSILSWRFQS